MHHLVHDTINKCDIDVRRELYNNIVLSGGTSMFEGISNRWVRGSVLAPRATLAPGTSSSHDSCFATLLLPPLSLVPCPVRLFNEITTLGGSAVKVRVVAPPERKFLVWIGGSILSSLSTFQSMWITREEYLEVGPNVVHRKCCEWTRPGWGGVHGQAAAP